MEAILEQTAAPTPSTAAAPVASLSGISKRYRNGVVALDNLSLTLRAGEVVALLGPNGAGKSTAVKLMMGLSAPTSGDVRIFGNDPRHAANRLRTGVMLQVGKAPETLKVREHIELFRGYYPHPLPTADLVRIAGLEGIEDRLYGQLSGGQKQRVLFALALAGDPDLVFLDEPTVGLDIEARRSMWAEIRSLAARGKTVLLTTHYLEEADALASRIVVIAKGRVICEGTSAQIKARGAAALSQPSRPDPTSTSQSRPEHELRSGAIPVCGTAAENVSVKLIRCTTTLTRDHLLAIPGVSAVDVTPGSTVVTTAQPESTLRTMLALDLHLTDLEVASPALEDAFLALTATQ